MRVLIDTNIFIERENYHIIPENLRELLRILNILKVEILVHPKSIEEIRKDGNIDRREISLSKLQTYPLLQSPPDPNQDEKFLSKVGPPTNERDSIDNSLLYAVLRDAVDFLLTEDKKIHDKALKLEIKDRVLSSAEALSIFKKSLPKEKVRSPPAIKEVPVYKLNLNDPFFNSLKKEYPHFEKWFKKISREGRKCWVYYKRNDSIGALLILKIENEYIDSTPPLPLRRRLKICTFKVTYIGNKLGELFIKLSVEYCAKNNIDEMYLTHYTKKEDYLVDLITEYGFFKAATKDSEDVYIKKLIPKPEDANDPLVKDPLSKPLNFSKKYYPSFYDGPAVKKFIVPIRPEYHNRLFVDYRKRQTTIPEHAGEFIVEGNTITKAYLCHSNINRISKGDILLFYRSRDKVLTSIGIVENAIVSRSKERIWRLVGKRTVYSIEEIEEMVKKPTWAILFQFHFHFKKLLKLEELKKKKILKKAPQSIVRITHQKYLKIRREGGLNERYTFDKTKLL